jgi:hypothetical protein
MNELIDIEEGYAKYTIIIDTIADMSGYTVEIIDRYNNRNYNLCDIYQDQKIAIQEADEFVNNLFELEISMLIN